MLNIYLLEKKPDSLLSISGMIRGIYADTRITSYPSLSGLQLSLKKEPPDVVVTDKKLNSEDLTKLSRKAQSNKGIGPIPLIFILPNNSSDELIDLLVDQGAEYVFRHPVSQEDLYVPLKVIQRKKHQLIGTLSDCEYLNRNLQKRSEILESRDKKFLSIFKQAPIGILIYDNSGRLVDHNQKALQTLGIGEAELESFCEMIQYPTIPNDIKYCRTKDRVARYRIEVDFDELRKESKYTISHSGKIYLSVQITQIAIEKNKFLYLVFLLDRTKRRFYEEQNRKLELAVKQSPNPIVITDRSGKIEYVNPEFSNLTGYSEAESIGKNPRFLKSGKIPKQDYKKLWETILNGGAWKGEFINKKKDGAEYIEEAVISPIFSRDGVITHFMGIKKDVTDLKKKERELSILSQAIDQSPRSIAITKTDRTIVYANSKFLELDNLTREEAIGRNIGTINQQINEKVNAIDTSDDILETLRSGQNWSQEFQITNQEGKIEWVKLSISPILDEHGKMAYSLAIREDVTERKLIEHSYHQEQIKAKRLAEVKSRFLSNMSHEIRTPLNGIIGLINILMSEDPRPDQVEYLQLLKFSSDHLLALINNILDLNKIDEGKLLLEEQDKDLELMLTNLLGTYQSKARERGIDMKLIYPIDSHKCFYFDKTRLTQIISNLLNNAMKFTHEGQVIVEVRHLSENKKTSRLRVLVKDSGVGIPADKLKQIFDRFTQADVTVARKYGGSGLGLSISRKLLELMGSDISVTSDVGKGTTFSFDLELKKGLGRDEISSSRNYNGKKITGDLKVLSVDDNMVNQLITEKYIKAWGGTIDKASDGYEAIDKIESQSFNLILMDIQMPGLNGLAATQIIRNKKGKFFKDVPIIAMSASSEQDQRDMALGAGMNYYLTKPYHPDELKTILVKYGKFRLHKDKNKPDTTTKNSEDKKDPFSMIRRQVEEYTADDGDFKVRFIESLFENLEELKSGLKQSLMTKNLEMLRQIHHKMKSSLVILKQEELEQIIEEMKTSLRTPGAINPDLLMTRFDDKMDELCGYLRLLLSSVSTSPKN
jgi:PAS domain S-box-containing protein